MTNKERPSSSSYNVVIVVNDVINKSWGCIGYVLGVNREYLGETVNCKPCYSYSPKGFRKHHVGGRLWKPWGNVVETLGVF